MAFAFNPAGEQQLSLFDSYNSLTEREKKFLDKSWAKYFAEYIFPKIDEKPYAVLYSNKDSRPNTPVNVQLGALLIKELTGLSDDEFLYSFMFDIRFQYALHTTSCIEQPISDRTLGRFRARCNDSLIMLIELGIITGFDDARDKINYILVYNSAKYPVAQKSESRDKNYAYIFERAGQEKRLFDIEDFEGYLFQEVHTYTKEMFQEKFVAVMEEAEGSDALH